MELEGKMKDKKLRRARRVAPKSSFNKKKNVLKVKSFAAHIPNGAPNLFAMKNHNYASTDDETSVMHLHLPPLLNPQSNPQTFSDATNENTNEKNSKTRKLKLLQASGSVANTMEDCDSSDSLNSGIQQGNIQFQITCTKHQDNGFDSEKETQEMIQDAVALGLGNPQELKGFKEGIMRNIDREVDEWTSVNQFCESIGKSGGIIAMWDSSVFEVCSVEFGGQWISLCGTHIPSSFTCMIIGVYTASSVKDRADMWEEITTLKFAFELPLVVLGDFNKTLHAHERSSGHLNSSGSTSFHKFISDCELVEFNLQGHRFTWFRGGSMNRIDRAFASPDFQLQFPSLSLCRYPRGMSDHCQLLLQSPEVDWGWKPFRFINCWLSHPSFLTDFEALWSESCKEFPVSLRKGRNYISKIEHNGSHLVSSNDIKEGAVNFFSSLFRKPTCKRIEMGGSGFSKISEAKSIWLERPPSMEEVKQAVWDCDGSKAPGPDGFTFCFYKKGPSRFSHFRPISLIHGLYKIVAKLLSTRLRHVMPDVISVNQSAFIAGRQILDGFMIANEVVHGVHSKKKHGLLLKEHIDTSMGYMGFGSHWRKLIFECLSNSKLAILINGSPSREFSLERGLRQGDPLSPFLFDIAVQGLTVLFNRASASGYFKGLQTTPGHYLTHLQYADDSLIFLPNDFPSLLHAKRILRWFEIISGLKVNFYKSLLIGINLDNDYTYTSSLANSVFCRSDTFPFFAMPKGVTKAISSLTRSFLWKGSSTSHGLFKVAWHKTMEWQEAGSLSPTWHGIVSAIFSTQNIANLLHANVGFKVGDGRNIRFWTDSWLGSATTLQLLFPRLYNLSLQQNTSLADIYNLTDASLNLSWRRTFRPREICQRESLIAEVQRGLLFSDGADCKLWKFHSSGMYSAQSGAQVVCTNTQIKIYRNGPD
ncbi:uncharacterized protein [Populus alba]|uniref:uncharacterized protein n=1 Tax=Populus alba TaxID=43335 RepID=UPI003CC733A6